MKTLRPYLLLLLMGSLITACDKDLVDDPPIDAGRRNFMVRFDYLFNGVDYKRDSLIVLGPTNKFRITDVNFLISSAFATRSIGDSIISENMFTWTTLAETDYLIGEIPAGSYNGHLGFTFGLDSLTNALPPTEFPRTPLSENNLFLDGIRGYSFIRIRGNAMNPDTTSLQTTIPFNYVVATTPLAYTVSKERAFSLNVGNRVVYRAIIDLGSLFDGLNPSEVNSITSDPTNPIDYERAEKIMQNFAARGFDWK
jgi:hypothetical protein